MTSTSATDAGPADLLACLERYYDEVPRAFATAHDLGPFTLFVRDGDQGWPYYARPRLGHQGSATVDDVRRVLDRQQELGAPQTFEWVAETSPGLADVVRAAGLPVTDHPLMVLSEPVAAATPSGVRVEALDADHPRLPEVLAAVGAGFGESDDLGPPQSADDVRRRMAGERLRLVGAFDADEVVGGGSHSPRDGVTELTGIAVLPRARGRGVGAAVTAALVEDARRLGVATVFLSAGTPRVADLYARLGFVTVGTACIAERS